MVEGERVMSMKMKLIWQTCDWLRRRHFAANSNLQLAIVSLSTHLQLPYIVHGLTLYRQLTLQSSMPKLVALYTFPARLKNPITTGRSFASGSRRRLAQPRHGLLSEPWLPPTSGSTLPITYFSPTLVRGELMGDGDQRNDHKAPDERTLKLGKS